MTERSFSSFYRLCTVPPPSPSILADDSVASLAGGIGSSIICSLIPSFIEIAVSGIKRLLAEHGSEGYRADKQRIKIPFFIWVSFAPRPVRQANDRLAELSSLMCSLRAVSWYVPKLY